MMEKNKLFDLAAEARMLEFLQKEYGPEVFTPGLERTKPLYDRFIKTIQDKGTKVVIVAGTNGKGQTAHTLTSFFKKGGKSFGLWTSPHILSLTERFVFGEEMLAGELEQRLYDAHSRVRGEHPQLKISFYEFLFYVFLEKASELVLEYLVLEVGLGGKLDAVNHFDADCMCITSISRDHQSILGSTYRQILSEKIAVSRPKRPLFTAFHLDYLNELTRDYVQQNGVAWKPLKTSEEKNYFLENQEMAWEIFSFFLPQFSSQKASFLSELPSYKGRREIMTFGAKSLIFIGAHNIDGMRRMLQAHDEEKSLNFDSVLLAFSKRPLDEVEVMLKSVMDFVPHEVSLKVTCFDHPKALSREDVRQAFEKTNKGMLQFVPDWKSDLQNSKSTSILVCGSYYFIGEVQRFILSTSN